MLDELEYPDKDLVKDISVGFRLTGWQSRTGVFPPCVKRPQFSVATLKKLAKGLNKAIVSQLAADNDQDDIVKQTWDKTQEEVALGYIWRDSSSDVGEVLLAKRFGLLQRGGKLRVIDDCSVGGINGALGVVEKYKVHAIDETAAFLTWMLQFSQAGCPLEGLSGRTYDHFHFHYSIISVHFPIISRSLSSFSPPSSRSFSQQFPAHFPDDSPEPFQCHLDRFSIISQDSSVVFPVSCP